MKLAHVLILLTLASTVLLGETAKVSSPDANIEVTVEADKLGLSYRVDYRSKPLVLQSGLGLDLCRGGFQIRKKSTRRSRGIWHPVYGERAEIPDNYNELSLDLEAGENSQHRLRLLFRAYDEGVAFRYTIVDGGSFTINAEKSEFHFPAGAMAYEEYGTEGPYRRVPVSEIKEECERPLTVDLGNGIYASVTEAAMVEHSRMLLAPAVGKSGVLVSDLSGPVKATAPYSTPWRVLIIGDRPGDLLERNYLVLNLNPPNKIGDTSWIKPGKVIREVTLSTKGGKECVDFAVEHGLQYVHYDAGWYGHEYDDSQDARTITPDPKRTSQIKGWDGLDLQEVIRYAAERGIGILVYVNRRHLEKQLDEILPLYRKWGIKGLKFGFVRVGEQEPTQWMHEAVRKAAEHQFVVDIHDAYRPTGFSRTYPNLLTQEGIRGNEHMPTAEHSVTLPFTRFLAGAGDHTICYYSPKIKTTRARRLAQSVVVYSPLQFLFWYDRPSAYSGEPEIEFFKRVPTVWDETRVIDGRIGEHIIVARRSGKEWFVGLLTNSQGRELTFPLDFLEEGHRYRVHIYKDGATPTEVLMEPGIVTHQTAFEAKLAPSGGQALRLEPID